jgi:hypothetical protein
VFVGWDGQQTAGLGCKVSAWHAAGLATATNRAFDPPPAVAAWTSPTVCKSGRQRMCFCDGCLLVANTAWEMKTLQADGELILAINWKGDRGAIGNKVSQLFVTALKSGFIFV